MTATARKLTKGEYWAALVLGRFTRTDGFNVPDGLVLLNGRVVDDGEVTGGWECLKLTVDGETFVFTTDALSNASVTTKGFPLVKSDKGMVELRFLSDSSASFKELAEAMFD